MVKAINGWTKTKILKHIEKNFKGKSYITIDGYEESCMYRGEHDKKCAIGMFIPDEVYSSEMEGVGVTAIIKDYGLENLMPFKTNYLDTFQFVHDHSRPQNTKAKLLKWVKENIS